MYLLLWKPLFFYVIMCNTAECVWILQYILPTLYCLWIAVLLDINIQQKCQASCFNEHEKMYRYKWNNPFNNSFPIYNISSQCTTCLSIMNKCSLRQSCSSALNAYISTKEATIYIMLFLAVILSLSGIWFCFLSDGLTAFWLYIDLIVCVE